VCRRFLLAACLLAGCHSGSAADGPAADAAPAPRAWQLRAIPTSALPSIRGFRPVRGILHSHSPYSHDACDNKGLTADGKPEPVCAADLRRGMCDAAEDFVFLTDHAAHMAEQPFDDLFLAGPGDVPVLGASGTRIASKVDCGDGRRVLVMVGNENRLMTAGLEKHLAGDATTRLSAYDGDDVATVEAMHAAGALVWVPHSESRPDDYLAAMPFDGMEIYNIHAAIDPDIRKNFFKLDSYAAAVSVLAYSTDDTRISDLALLAFLEDLPVYQAKWDKLLPTRHVTGTVGTDVHQNTFPGTMTDGERGDSYRRLMRWFSNVLLVSGDLDPANVKKTLAAGRGYVAVEVLGVPAGFDFHAEAASSVYEMGAEAPAGATIVVRAPVVHDLDPAATLPLIRMRLLRVTASGTAVAGEGPAIELPKATAGAYRVEVRITPLHLKAYLGEVPDKYIKDSIWVLSNPIYVK
jgi:hypothetical protein